MRNLLWAVARLRRRACRLLSRSMVLGAQNDECCVEFERQQRALCGVNQRS